MIELLRRNVRARLGYRSPSYRLAAKTYTNAAILLREGYGTLSQLRRLEAAARRPDAAESVRFRNLAHPVFLRPGTDDVGAAINNIIRREYGQFNPKDDPATMIDAGAYIGDTSAYFLSRFPKLRIIALEPNSESYPLAQRNLAPYGDRVDLRNEALCAERGTIRFGGVDMGARVGAEHGVEVTATTLSDLIESFPERRINILKLDIEGAETELFKKGADDWLPYVDHMIVETHGPESTAALMAALARNEWTHWRYRNLYFCEPREALR